MMTTVVYLGDGDVGEAVVYGLPFTVGVPVKLPPDFPFTAKIVNNGTFRVVTETHVPTVSLSQPQRRGRNRRAGQ